MEIDIIGTERGSNYVILEESDRMSDLTILTVSPCETQGLWEKCIIGGTESGHFESGFLRVSFSIKRGTNIVLC